VSYVKLIESELEKFHVETPSARINYLAQYCEELDRWNKKINLTGLSGEAMVRRLVQNLCGLAMSYNCKAS
jgi:16S rRNA G527 N7-methylase RsmG